MDSFLPRLSFFFSADAHFLEEVAKFRAARRLWGALAKEMLGAKLPRSAQLRFHTQTAGSSLTAQQPELNVVRTTLEALSAVLGGTQSLHTNALDEALGLPSAESARLALRTQQIIAEESGVPSTVDPLGGAYAIEHLTDQVEEEARRYLDRIEALGGAQRAIERGFFQAEIAREAYRTARAREERRELVVGVNAFSEGGEEFSLFPARGRKGPAFQRVTTTQEESQRRRVQRFRRMRDARAAQRALDELARITDRGENVMPAVLDAVQAEATLGEISDVWRQRFGEYSPSRQF